MCLFFFNDTSTIEIYTLSLHDALPISTAARDAGVRLPVAIDVDTALRPVRGVTVGVLRSPVRTPGQAADLARSLAADPHLDLVALMAYDAQVAGVGDNVPGRPARSRAVRALQ